MLVRYKTRKRRAPKPRVDWTKASLPGDLIQIDTKYISQHGTRLYQYTLIDVVSRWRYVEIHRQSDMKTTIDFLGRALKQSAFVTLVIQSDNGSEFGQSVTKWLRDHKIKHVFSHKGRPTENAYVERSHRTDEEEFYSVGKMGETLQDLRDNVADYMDMYNTKRPHWGLGGKTPQEMLTYYSMT
ncbi:DDE-type integrase/transposase/recombinase [Patescibacteria group bacterium]